MTEGPRPPVAGPARPERIVLVGFMACGKSTVGPALARLLEWDFVDMDRLIEERCATTVAEIFRQRGEPAFREEERHTALDLGGRPRLVVAAGGGAFVFPETRQALQAGATTVWLRCDLNTVLSRLPRDGLRPLAANRETIERLFAERQPFYRLADWSVDASRTGPAALARQIVDTVFTDRARWARGSTDR